MKDLYRLLRNLRNRERGVQPDAAWVSATRDRLLMQVKNSIPTKEVAKINRKFVATTRRNVFAVLKGPATMAVSILVVIFSGSLMSVRAAEYSLPGDMLYTVKLVTEQTRLAFESSKSEKVRLKLEFTKRRVEDLKTLMDETDDRKTERVGKAADILKQDLNTLKQQLSETSDHSASDTNETLASAKVVDRAVVEVAKTLRDTDKSGLDDETRQKMNDAEIQATDVGLQALSVLINSKTDSENPSGITDEEITASLMQHTTVVQEAVANVLALTSSASSTESGQTSSALQNTQTSSSAIGAVTSTESGVSVPNELAKDAEVALQEVQDLLNTNQTVEAVLKLKEVTAKSFLAQTELQKLLSGTVTNTQDDSLIDSNTSSTSPSSVSDENGGKEDSTSTSINSE